jgi:hypothetical protein
MECDKLRKCVGITRNNDFCNKKCTGKYCQFHEYFNDYTDEMMKNLTLCTGCSMQKYLPNGGVCNVCIERGKKAREKFRENVTLCKYIDKKPCTFKIEPKLKNGYCGKHQTYFWKEDQEKDGVHKVCINFIRGCRNLLGKDNEFSRCVDCRDKDRPRDKVRNIVRKEKREVNNEVIKNKEVNERSLDDEMICRCGRLGLTLKDFLEDENNIESKLFETCKKCRDNDIVRNKDEERIKYKQDYEKSEKRLEYVDNNIEKRVQITSWSKYKIKKIKDLGLREFISMKNIRYDELKPKYLKKINEYYEKKKSNKEYILSNYRKSAKDRNLLFNLLEDDFYKLIENSCYYCGFLHENHFNGVDRLNSDLNYDKENCVSCCSECNFLKIDFEKDKFINMILHILTNFRFLKQFNFSIFSDCISGDFNKYIAGAIKRGYEFKLENDKFIIIQSMNCYLCNKPSDSKNHINGIDRINNKIGYIYENILPCCKDCNKLKNNYPIEYLFTKFYNIVNHYGHKIDLDLEAYLEKINKIILNKKQFLLNELEINCENSEKSHKLENSEKNNNINNKLSLKARKNKMLKVMGENAYKNYVNIEKNYYRYKKSTSSELMKIYADKLSEIKVKYPKIFSKSIVETKKEIIDKGIKKIDDDNIKKDFQEKIINFKLNNETHQKIKNLEACINHFKKKNNDDKVQEYEDKLDNYKVNNKKEIEKIDKTIKGDLLIEDISEDINENDNDNDNDDELLKNHKNTIESNYCRITKNDIPLKQLIGKENHKIYHKVESNLSYAKKTNNVKKEKYYEALLNYLKSNINTCIQNKTLNNLNLRKLENEFVYK